LIVLLFVACTPTRPPTPGSPVDVTLHDFRIDTATPSVVGGAVVFHIRNAAPATHEFVVVRTDLPADQLPIAADGLSVDEDQLRSVGEISQVETETTASLALSLAPGHYVFFCNLEGHYLGGMHGSLVVTPDATS
jgi:uncharacterized cupredoxin-like copper-binding protein